MCKRKISLVAASLFYVFLSQSLCAQDVSVAVDASHEKKLISPYIYGKNGNLSEDPSKPTSAKDLKKIEDAGLHFAREFGGNNGSKYNWKLKLTSHPDWYNNVYSHDWDFAARELDDKLTDVQGMWAFQLTGYAAKTKDYNFDDWTYNKANWWTGVNQNLAGNGTVNPDGGGKAMTEGDPSLYLQTWNADSTVGIIEHWFGNGGLGLDKTKFKYWSMDNESEIWSGTHDDILPVNVTAEEYMQRYFEVAKKARAAYPDIKICGPVTANEWQWYTWDNKKIDYKGSSYPWLEYFILRCAEEEKASGVRLLDVVDIHFYPTEVKDADILQLHRVYYDKNYNYPGANGAKVSGSSGWDQNIKQEYIFERINQWLTKYMETGHNIGLGLSEYGMTHNSATVTAVSYASILGTFADNGVELFSPWFWEVGMWETMHLFSRYSQQYSISSVSDNETKLSAYSSVNEDADSLTVVLVNRSQTETLATSVNITNFAVPDGYFQTLQLAELPKTETFVSHSQNALKKGTVTALKGRMEISLPPLSITAAVLTKTPLASSQDALSVADIMVYPNPATENITVNANEHIENITVSSEFGQIVLQKQCKSSVAQIDLTELMPGIYFVSIYTTNNTVVRKILKQ